MKKHFLFFLFLLLFLLSVSDFFKELADHHIQSDTHAKLELFKKTFNFILGLRMEETEIHYVQGDGLCFYR